MRTSTRRWSITSPSCARTAGSPILASYSVGARERLAGLLKDHDLQGGTVFADRRGRRRSAPPIRAKSFGRRDRSCCRSTMALPRPTSPFSPNRTCSAIDSIRRRQAQASQPTPSSPSWRRSTPGRPRRPYAEHGIGRYHRADLRFPCRQAPRMTASRSNMPATTNSIVPVENLEVLSRYGSGEDGASARQARRRGVATTQVEDEGTHPRDRRRADRGGRRASAPPRRRSIERRSAAGYPSFVDRFPYHETDDQDRAIERRASTTWRRANRWTG